MEKMIELKNWLKTAAIEIRLLKNTYKENQRQGLYSYGWSTNKGRLWRETQSDLHWLRREYRHMHIAYSELRGKTRDQIEASYPYKPKLGLVNDPVRPDEEWIQKIKNEYGQKYMNASYEG